MTRTWLSDPNGSVAIWVGSAIVALFLVSHAPRVWPVLLLATFLSDLAVSSAFGATAASAVVPASINTTEALLAAWAWRLSKSRSSPRSVGSWAFPVLVALLIPLGSSLLQDAFAAATSSPAQFSATGWSIYGSRVLGLLSVVPLLVQDGTPATSRIGLARITLWATMALLPGGLYGAALLADLQLYLLLAAAPLLLAVTICVGRTAGWAATLGLAVASAAGAAQGFGPLPSHLATAGIGDVAILQLCLGTAFLSVGLVAGSMAERPAVANRSASDDRAQASDLPADERRTTAGDLSRAKLDFLSAMGHELRSPIAAILGLADLLDDAALKQSERSYLDTIKASGNHLLAVINDVLDYARGERGRLRLASVDFSMADLLDQVRLFVAPQAQERALDLYVDTGGELPAAVKGDPARLRQILLNLIGNALKFTHRGSIDLVVRHQLVGDAAMFRFEVRDTGVGMTQAKLDSLFQAFDLESGVSTRRYGGIGLGLAISKRLVTAMNGSIGVESQPGQGSLFWFEVTLELGDVGEKVPLDIQSIPKRRILVVDDGAVNRRVLLQMLQRYGHQVTCARHGLEAVEMVVRGNFDLVLMDIQMPVMDGMEATRLIRELPGAQGQVPIIGVTASIMPQEFQSCLDVGMQHVLPKPVEWSQLFMAIASLDQPLAVSDRS